MNACCEDPKNRRVVEEGDRKIEQCVVCERRHYELTVDPGEIPLKGAKL